MSVRKASKVYGVPMQTLRDRVLGHVEPEATRYYTFAVVFFFINVAF